MKAGSASTDSPVAAGVHVTVEWLLQAGFILTGPSGAVAIDPYLSDICEHVYGLRRGTPAPYVASDLPVGIVLVTHWHEDHLDLDSALELANNGVTFIGPPSCGHRLAGRGVPADQFIRITAGETVARSGITVTAVPARHNVAGFLTEDAVGYVVELDGARIYHSGDTEYDRTLLVATEARSLTAALVCINGSGGNMNAIEAAVLVAQLSPMMAIPMHFGLWVKGPADLDDQHMVSEFVSRLERLDARIATRVPSLDGPIVLHPRLE